MMKRKLFTCLTIAGAFCLTNSQADDDVPRAQSFSRYEPMLKHSPFAVATADAPVGALPDFAKDLYIANAAHFDDGDFVTVASTTDRTFKEYLSTKGAVDGYSLPNVQWSNRVGETKVTIVKDGQSATLSFNEAILGQTLAAQQPAPVTAPPPGMPNRAALNLPNQRPFNPQIVPTPQPHTRGVIRRPQTPIRQPQVPNTVEPEG